MISVLKRWGKERAKSILITLIGALMLLQFFVGSVLDLLIGLLIMGIVHLWFRLFQR